MKPIPFTDMLQNHLGRTNMAPQGENRHQNTGMAEIKSPPTNCILYSENVVLLDKRRNRIPAPSDYNTMLPKDGRAFTMAGRNDRSGKFDKGISPTAVKPPIIICLTPRCLPASHPPFKVSYPHLISRHGKAAFPCSNDQIKQLCPLPHFPHRQ